MPRKQAPDNFYRTSEALASKIVVKPVTLRLPPAHQKQFELITAHDRIPGCRFVVGACGSKFGKTFGCTITLVKQAWTNKGSLNWWVAPTYGQSENAYNAIKRLLPRGTFQDYKADLRLVLLEPDGSEHSVIEFKSGDKPDTLRGFAVNFFVMDEAALSKFESAESIMTTLTQTMGKGLFISTPKGKNWFYDWYQRGEKFFADGTPKFSNGEDDPFAEWFAIRMPTWTNPHVNLEAIRQFKKNMPADSFKQEIAAQFLEDGAGVFKTGIRECIKGLFQPYLPGHRYVLGVDLAKLKDYTVLTVMDAEQKHVVHHERFNHIPWPVQKEKIIDVAKRYRARVSIDSTGIGDPIVDELQLHGLMIEPYKISSNAAKAQLIDGLRISIEQQKISYPEIPVLRRELESYEFKFSDNGTVKYNAPSGQHDDCVISLALANWLVSEVPWVYRASSHRGI